MAHRFGHLHHRVANGSHHPIQWHARLAHLLDKHAGEQPVGVFVLVTQTVERLLTCYLPFMFSWVLWGIAGIFLIYMGPGVCAGAETKIWNASEKLQLILWLDWTFIFGRVLAALWVRALRVCCLCCVVDSHDGRKP